MLFQTFNPRYKNVSLNFLFNIKLNGANYSTFKIKFHIEIIKIRIINQNAER